MQWIEAIKVEVKGMEVGIIFLVLCPYNIVHAFHVIYTSPRVYVKVQGTPPIPENKNRSCQIVGYMYILLLLYCASLFFLSIWWQS